MRELWPVYHPDIPEFLQALAETPELRRLKEIGMNCGCEYTAFPRFRRLRPYSRFDHSMGVGLIVWHFTHDPAQAIAGTLHDVATPVFAHVVDFLRGDHLRQETTEERTEEIIARSPDIQAVLSSLALGTADVSDYHRYPIADNDTPRLSADRLEYTLGNLVNYDFLTVSRAACLYRDLAVSGNEDGLPELTFQTPGTASAFTESALQTARIYVADEDRFAMQVLADLLRLSLERGVLSEADLYGTEPAVIQKLLDDSVCGSLWQRFRGYAHISRRAQRPAEGQWLSVPAKLRYIDPLAAGAGRVSHWDPHARKLLEEFRATAFDVWLGPV